MIHINRNRENLGKFTEQEVADGLKSGKFLPSDLAWQEPMETWKPLETFTDLPAASDVVEPETPAEPEVPAQPAWERLGWGGLVESVKQVFTAPVETFRAMPPAGGYSKPMWFYTVTLWVGLCVRLVYSVAIVAVNPAMVFGEYAKHFQPPEFLVLYSTFALLFALFLPVFLIAASFVSASLWHVSLLMTGAATKPFQATYRAVAYSCGVSGIFLLVPIWGVELFFLSQLVYGVIALKEAHRAVTLRVILAAFSLILIFCGLALCVSVGFMSWFEGLGLPMPK